MNSILGWLLDHWRSFAVLIALVMAGLLLWSLYRFLHEHPILALICLLFPFMGHGLHARRP